MKRANVCAMYLLDLYHFFIHLNESNTKFAIEKSILLVDSLTNEILYFIY